MILIQQPLLDFNFLHAEAIFLMVIKGGESSSQFRWFTIAKIEL